MSERPELRAAVVALDPRSQQLVRPLPPEHTPRERDQAITEPERTPGGHAHYREPASGPPQPDKAALLRGAPVIIALDGESPTRSDPTSGSDVFAPLRTAPRAVDLDPPTPRDRPHRLVAQDVATELDGASRATVTLPVAPALRAERALPERPREDPATARERQLVLSVYDTQRAFFTLQAQQPERAAHVLSLQRALTASGVFGERELALAVHARDKTALAGAPPEQRDAREDRVFAIGLLAREIDDQYREQTRALHTQLLTDVRALEPAHRDQVFADFDTFVQSDAANDSNFCRRELHRALREEHVLHRAYVIALALDRKSDPQRVDASAATLLAELTGAARRP